MLPNFLEYMLINKEWSNAQKLTYGKNITLEYSNPGFIVKVFNESGASYEKQISEEKVTEIRAADIMNISHPMIIFKTNTVQEIHVRINCPDF